MTDSNDENQTKPNRIDTTYAEANIPPTAAKAPTPETDEDDPFADDDGLFDIINCILFLSYQSI